MRWSRRRCRGPVPQDQVERHPAALAHDDQDALIARANVAQRVGPQAGRDDLPGGTGGTAAIVVPFGPRLFIWSGAADAIVVGVIRGVKSSPEGRGAAAPGSTATALGGSRVRWNLNLD